MDTINEKVQEWIDNGKDYHSGIAILRQHGNKRALVKFLERGEPNNAKREHLEYNLLRLGRVIEVKTSEPELPAEIVLRADDTDIKAQTQKNYPPEVIELKALKAKLYNERAVEHKKFLEVGKSNDAESVKRRKEIRDAIVRITDDFHATDAQIQAIFDKLSGKTTDVPQQPASDNQNKSDNNNQLSPAEVLALQKEFDNNVAYISKNKDSVKAKTIKNAEERKARNEEIKKLLEGVK